MTVYDQRSHMATTQHQPHANEESLLEAVDALKFFLATAPGQFDPTRYHVADPLAREEQCLKRFSLPTGDIVSCIYWNGLYYITGTDVVRALNFRFLAFGRPVKNAKKFEEGIFSDLRNLKSGIDASLEEPKSEFLELLFKFNCIRTQKKQKVFFWYSVPHDRLFLDALDRDLKREKLGQDTTTEAVAEPALSFTYNPQRSLYDQFCNPATAGQYGNDATAAQKQLRRQPPAADDANPRKRERSDGDDGGPPSQVHRSSSVLGQVSLFEGSPNYKQRRRPSSKRESSAKRKSSASITPSPAPEGRRPSLTPILGLGGPPMNGSYSMPSLPMFAPPLPTGAPRMSSFSHPPPAPVVVPPVLTPLRTGSRTPQNDVRSFVCPLFSCGRLFKHLEHLKRHVQTHAPDKPYACSLCQKRFSRPSLLSAHTRIHDRMQHVESTADHLELQQEDAEIDEQEGAEDASHQEEMARMVSSMQDFGHDVSLEGLSPSDERGVTPLHSHPPSSSFPMPSPYMPGSAPLPYARNGWPSPFGVGFNEPPQSAPASALPDHLASPQHMPSPTFARSASIAHLPPKSAGFTAADFERRHRSATPTVGGPRTLYVHPSTSFSAPAFQRASTHTYVGSSYETHSGGSYEAHSGPYSAADHTSAIFSHQLEMVNALGTSSADTFPYSSASEPNTSLPSMGFEFPSMSSSNSAQHYSRSPLDLLPPSLPSISSGVTAASSYDVAARNVLDDFADHAAYAEPSTAAPSSLHHHAFATSSLLTAPVDAA